MKLCGWTLFRLFFLVYTCHAYGRLAAVHNIHKFQLFQKLIMRIIKNLPKDVPAVLCTSVNLAVLRFKVHDSRFEVGSTCTREEWVNFNEACSCFLNATYEIFMVKVEPWKGTWKTFSAAHCLHPILYVCKSFFTDLRVRPGEIGDVRYIRILPVYLRGVQRVNIWRLDYSCS